MMTDWTVGAFRRRLNSAYRSFTGRTAAQRRRAIDGILASPAPPHGEDLGCHFDTLQWRYEGLPEYGYDSFSSWKRGIERAQQLLGLPGMQLPGRRVLEVACGDGMAGFILSGYSHDVQLTDAVDWRDTRAQGIAFEISDVCSRLPFADASFDLVYSYNAFEHFPDPRAAFSEIVRVCRPNGLLYFQFGPLYASPWGLHAYRMFHMPYPQFLFSAEFIRLKLREVGIQDLGQERSELQFTNQWRVEQFHALWQSKGCEIIEERVYRDIDHLDTVCRYPWRFQGHGLTYDDLTIQALLVTLRKPAIDAQTEPTP